MHLSERRNLYDALAKHGIAIGGTAVILAIVLIFFYLLIVVAPLFFPADVDEREGFAFPGADTTLMLTTEELGEVGMRVTGDGKARFFSVSGGGEVAEPIQMPIPTGAQISSFSIGQPGGAIGALGFSDGTALVFQYGFDIRYPNDVRTVVPKIEYPLGETFIEVDPRGDPLELLAIRASEEENAVAAIGSDKRLLVATLSKEENMMTGEVSVESGETFDADLQFKPTHLLLGPQLRSIYVADDQRGVSYFDLSDGEEMILKQRVEVADNGTVITQMRFLLEGISVLIGTNKGELSQWFLVRDENNEYTLQRVRGFEPMPGSVTQILAEPRRKGFIVGDKEGNVGIYHATAARLVYSGKLADGSVTQLGISPRSKVLIVESEGQKLSVVDVHNEHPEVSFSALWGKVWYESYAEPQYMWQSSSATQDFEPKYSLVPLTFGTFKAAFFAMLVAVPLGILGAIYTANFMHPKMRTLVKPTIELMEALPTVILGFLAGLWLAPFLERYLPGVMALLIGLPIGMLACAWLWTQLPRRMKNATEGWEGALLIPLVIIIAIVSISLSQPMEATFFGGDIRAWITNDLGITYDQRNSIVVGLAMGFAVIPTIYSISEDAIFSVPRHLINGSLALGATSWQTLVRVVMPTASPGIFSALMMGLGRAVGETMIVLMATGNTPVMDMSIFQGMRTLSANIAVEMPESEVDSTHYRILFLAALVLFLLTFMFNTGAEIVRQRLRKKYSSL